MERKISDIERDFRAALDLVTSVEPDLDEVEEFMGALRDWQAGMA